VEDYHTQQTIYNLFLMAAQVNILCCCVSTASFDAFSSLKHTEEVRSLPAFWCSSRKFEKMIINQDLTNYNQPLTTVQIPSQGNQENYNHVGVCLLISSG
jgi:hypothetical protein